MLIFTWEICVAGVLTGTLSVSPVGIKNFSQLKLLIIVAINNWNRGFEVPLEVQISFKGLKSYFRRCEHHIICKLNCSYKTDIKFTSFAVLCLNKADPCEDVRTLVRANRATLLPVKFSSVYQP